jgi:hypothetical protein
LGEKSAFREENTSIYSWTFKAFFNLRDGFEVFRYKLNTFSNWNCYSTKMAAFACVHCHRKVKMQKVIESDHGKSKLHKVQ